MKTLRVIISGGGTGGHIFPAIAIAKAIQEVRPDADILFVGAEGKMEMEKVPAAGFRIIGLPIVGLQRRLTLKNVWVPFKLLLSLIKARKIVRQFKPDLAIGVGGYASGPLLRSAVSMGVKALIQEQNSYPGITNKILAKHVDRICVAYPNMEQFFPASKIVVTGNPVRSEVIKLDGKRNRGMEYFGLDSHKKTILIIGGSLGARTINESVQKSLPIWLESDLQIVWQTGKGYFHTAQEFVKTLNKQVVVREFIQEMDMAYAVADLIVSRAGAMSISEICLVNKPAIFIPSPNVAEDHQTKNAMALVLRGAAELVADSDAKEKLAEKVVALIKDEQRMNTLAVNIAGFAHPDATEAIVAEAFSLIKK